LVALTDGGNKAKAEAAVNVQTEPTQPKKER
jgi:hypothetical protein